MKTCGSLLRTVSVTLMAAPSAPSRWKTVCRATTSVACSRTGAAISGSVLTAGVVHYDGRLFQTINSPHIGPVCRILEDRDGTFWFGTVAGSIIRYRLRQTPPRIRLIRVTTDQVYENAEDVCSSTVGQPVVFEYKGLSFSTPANDMLYEYRLQGYDPDWHPATRQLQACYQNLPPGDYTFQVRAIDRDLNYSETGAGAACSKTGRAYRDPIGRTPQGQPSRTEQGPAPVSNQTHGGSPHRSDRLDRPERGFASVSN